MLALITVLVTSHYVIAQTIPKPGDKTIALFNAIRSGSSAELRTQLANGASANDSLKNEISRTTMAVYRTTRLTK